MTIPKQIVATKQVIYDTDFAFFLAKENGIDTTNWTLEDVVQMLEMEISRDFGDYSNPTIEVL